MSGKRTVKQLKDTIELMREAYPFDDDKTFFSTCNSNPYSNEGRTLELTTKDEKTGTTVNLSHSISTQEE